MEQTIFDSTDWYYSIEVEPGRVTPGKFGRATVLTRRMLKHCSIERQRCLDIGPMEGMIPAIMARRGAGSITAIDVNTHHRAKIDYLKKSLSFDFDFIAPLALANAPAHFRAMNVAAFDLVVFSGVLYHVLDVTAALAAVRALVRTGGIVIVESWLHHGSEVAAYFNDRGRITNEPNTFWFLAVGGLDYLLRFMCLEPIDCCYFNGPKNTLRLATACRAVADAGRMPERTDDWMRSAAELSVDANAAASMRLPSMTTVPLAYANERTSLDLSDYVESAAVSAVDIKNTTLWLADSF